MRRSAGIRTPGSFPINATSAASILTLTSDFGADGAAAINATQYGLSLAGGGSSLVTTLATAQGDLPITLVQTNATTITGQYNGTLTAFTVVINDDGTLDTPMGEVRKKSS